MMKKLKPLERIVGAARVAFRENGVKNTTMEDISRLANISRPNIYRYVQNRDDLVKIVILDCADNMLHELKSKKGDWKTVLLDSFIQLIGYAIDDEVYMLIIDQASSKAVQLFVDDVDVNTSLNQVFLPFIEQGRLSGEIKPDLSDDEILYWLHYQLLCFARDPKAHNKNELEMLTRKFVIGALSR